MFSGEYLCKLDEKGRFLLPPSIRVFLSEEGLGAGRLVVFLKVLELASLRVYPQAQWDDVLKQARAKLDEEQSRLFMHFVVSETSMSEVDKAGRILIPGKLRKYINLDDDQEIVLVGMYEHLEVWGPTEWRRYVQRTQDQNEASMSKIMDLL